MWIIPIRVFITALFIESKIKNDNSPLINLLNKLAHSGNGRLIRHYKQCVRTIPADLVDGGLP